MDPRAFWSLIFDAWVAAGEPGPPATPTAAHEAVFVERVVPALREQLERLPVAAARRVIDRLRDLAEPLDRADVRQATSCWDFDDPSAVQPIIALFGEAAHRAALADGARAAWLAGMKRLPALDVPAALVALVHERWRHDLLARIAAAFDDVPTPSDRDLTSADWGTDEDATYFCGKPWRGHPYQELHYRRADLSFFTPVGAHYVLPAFMVATLEDTTPVPGGDLPSAVAFGLAYDSPATAELRALLSPAQREAAVDFLCWVYDWTPSHGWIRATRPRDPYLEPALAALAGPA